jgi:predicted nucleotide-binding protein
LDISARSQNAIAAIKRDLEELNGIVASARGGENIEAAFERFKRWKERAVRSLAENVSQEEGRRLQEKRKGSFIMGQPLRNLSDEARMYAGFLGALLEELEKRPEEILGRQAQAEAVSVAVPGPPASRTVFIIHGHDELNLLRLRQMMNDRWGLNSIVLKDKPSKGRTLVEKFEDEAQAASFAFALLSPDDIVQGPASTYLQARPNVTFELGWFYGRLGRERVYILLKKGTKIHSDLDGITRAEFDNSIEETISQIEAELKAAGLV